MTLKARIKRAVAGTPLDPLASRVARGLRRLGMLGEPEPERVPVLEEDRRLVEIMRRILREDSCGVDVGASVGLFLVPLLEFAPRGAHVAFEPIPWRARRLQRDFPRVTVHAMALADVAGERDFHVVLDDTGYSGFEVRDLEAAHRIQTLRVPVATLDGMLTGGPPVDFIKIDVEGAELQVLRGARSTLTRHRPYVAFEHGPGAATRFGTTPDAVFDLLHDELGYRLYLFQDWLAGAPPLDRPGFVGQFGGPFWNFLAAPGAPPTRGPGA